MLFKKNGSESCQIGYVYAVPAARYPDERTPHDKAAFHHIAACRYALEHAVHPRPAGTSVSSSGPGANVAFLERARQGLSRTYNSAARIHLSADNHHRLCLAGKQ